MQKVKTFAIIAGVVLAIILVGGLILAGIFGVLQDVLYITLFVLALLMVGATVFQIYSILMLVRTVTTVRDEMKPLIASVQETVGIVKNTAQTAGHTVSTISNTAKLTSDFAMAPSVRAVSAVVAGQQMVRVFLGRGRVKTRSDERRSQQLEAMHASVEGGE